MGVGFKGFKILYQIQNLSLCLQIIMYFLHCDMILIIMVKGQTSETINKPPIKCSLLIALIMVSL